MKKLIAVLVGMCTLTFGATVEQLSSYSKKIDAVLDKQYVVSKIAPMQFINDGRDHHPGAFCGVLIGAGIKGGQVYGKSDDKGMKAIENIISPADFNATIAVAAGLPINHVLLSPEGRPFKLADKGVPVSALLA